MKDFRRHTVMSAAMAMTGCLLLAACADGAAAGKTQASVAQTTAGATTATAAPSGSTPTTSAAPTDPASADATPTATLAADTTACALITEADATTTLGADPGPGIGATGVHGSSQCHFGAYKSKFVLVNITPSQGQLAYDNMRNNPDASKAGAVIDIAGVGDQAFEVDSHGSAGIFFRKGDALVVVSVVFYLAPSPPTDQVRALAKLLASRI